MVHLAKHASSTADHNDELTSPQRAKRIPRPAHWKRISPPVAAPKVSKNHAAIMPAPTASGGKATAPAAEEDDWRTDPNFLMRAMACLCVMNFLLFAFFPHNPLVSPTTNETFLATGGRSMLPAQGSADEMPTLYAPVRKHSVKSPVAAGELRIPSWLRESQ